MDVRSHSTFKDAYNRSCVKWLAFCGLAAIGYGESFFAGEEIYDDIALFAFGASVAATVMACFVRLYRVTCPDCGATTKVSRSTTEYEWLASFHRCEVMWRLGISAI